MTTDKRSIMDRKWFAVAASSRKSSEAGWQVLSRPMAVFAVSLDEACGMAIKEMRETYPVESGWYDYQASAVEVPAKPS
jgi:hypothetical protein